MKQIAVIGLGQFGTHLALSLAKNGCQVIAVDRNEANVAQIREKVDRAMILDARDAEALSSAITPDLDEVVVSLGESMEASILCTLHLKKLGVARIRAKAVSEDHATILLAVGADQVIYPEREAAQRLAAQMVNPNVLDFVPLAADYQVLELLAPPAFQGRSFIELDLRKQFKVFVIAVKQGASGSFVFMPPPDFAIAAGDVLVAIGKRADLERMAGR